MTNKLIAGIVFFVAVLLPCRGDEPLYAGRPLAFWLNELKSDDPLIGEEALAVLSEAGAAARAATPAILKRTHHSNPYLRAASLSALKSVADPKEARQAAIQALKDDHPLVRCRAVILLAHVDPKHPDILPLSLELLKQPVGRDELFLVLSRMGPQAEAAVPTLTKLVADADQPTRRAAIQTLRQIGLPARPAVPALVEQLNDLDPITRLEALQTLRAIGADSSTVVAASVEAAKRDTGMQYSYLELLGDYGPKAAAAVPWLVAELQRQPPSPNLLHIAEALYKINPQRARKEARPALQRFLQPGNRWRLSAAAALRRAEPDNNEALQILIDGAASDQRPIRLESCNYLGMLGKSAAKAAPALHKALGDSDHIVRHFAAVALWQVTGETDLTAPILLETLNPAPDNHYRYSAAYCLGQMGAALDKSALPQLRKFRDDADPYVRDNVRRAIEQLESSAKKTKSP